MSASDEELPYVSLDSPEMKFQPKGLDFYIPDAGVLVVQRETEKEQKETLPENLECFFDNNRSLRAKNSDSDDDLDSDERRLKSIIKNLEAQNNNIEMSGFPSQTICYDDNSIPFGYTGIEIGYLLKVTKDLNLSAEWKRKLSKTVTELENFKMDRNLETYLNNFLFEKEEKISDIKSIKTDEMYTEMYIIFGILLDKKLSSVPTDVSITDILCLFLIKIKETKSSVMTICQRLMKIFKDPYDRLYMAIQCGDVKCNPTEIETNTYYIGNKLAKYILYHSIFDILQLNYNEKVVQSNSLYALKKLLISSEDDLSTSLYKQHILLKTIVALNDYIPVLLKKKANEVLTKKWFLKYFGTLIAKYPRFSKRTQDISTAKMFLSDLSQSWG